MTTDNSYNRRGLLVITPMRLRRLAIIAGIGVALALIYYFMDPATSPYAPKCIFRVVTGYECPGCGSQRFIHAILHGDIPAAASANFLLLPLLPYLLFWIWIETDPSLTPRLHRALNSIPAIITLLIIFLLWTLIRNFLLSK